MKLFPGFLCGRGGQPFFTPVSPRWPLPLVPYFSSHPSMFNQFQPWSMIWLTRYKSVVVLTGPTSENQRISSSKVTRTPKPCYALCRATEFWKWIRAECFPGLWTSLGTNPAKWHICLLPLWSGHVMVLLIAFVSLFHSFVFFKLVYPFGHDTGANLSKAKRS